MKYSVNEEGLGAMKTMSVAIIEALEQIRSQTKTIRATSDDYQNTLGPHKISLDEALSDIAENVKQASVPTNSVAEKLTEIAEAYEEIIGNDRIKIDEYQKQSFNHGARNVANTGAAKGGCGLISRILGVRSDGDKRNDTSFGNGITLVQDKLKSSWYFAKGNHYEEFADYWENASCYTEDACEGNHIEFVPAKDIEGIYLSDTDLADVSGFWGRRTGGTQETFVKIAEQIPTVKSLLDSGKTYDEIVRERPELEICVGIYFADTPEVSKAEGFYVFGHNGRHRELAVHSINGIIPVRVTGLIKHI